MAHRVVAIVTDPIGGQEATRQLSEAASGGAIELRLIAPAVEANPLRHTFGDIDEPKREARQKLDSSLKSLRESGLEASGAVGDPDPILGRQGCPARSAGRRGRDLRA